MEVLPRRQLSPLANIGPEFPLCLPGQRLLVQVAHHCLEFDLDGDSFNIIRAGVVPAMEKSNNFEILFATAKVNNTDVHQKRVYPCTISASFVVEAELLLLACPGAP